MFSTMAPIRSDSFTRSSPAPATWVRPCALAAAIAKAGISSTKEGISFGSIRVAVSVEGNTVIGAGRLSGLARLGGFDLESGPHALEYREDPGPGWVEADVLQDDGLGSLAKQAEHDQEGRRGDVSGDPHEARSQGRRRIAKLDAPPRSRPVSLRSPHPSAPTCAPCDHGSAAALRGARTRPIPHRPARGRSSPARSRREA